MANIYSTDLENNSDQWWSISDASQSGLDINSDFTMALWIKPESAPLADSNQQVMTKWERGGAQRSYQFALTDVSGTKKMQLAISSDGVTAVTKTVNQTFTNGTWYHIAVSYNKSAGSCKFYVNGAQVGTTQTGFATSIFNGSAQFEIGGSDGDESLNRTFDGLINDAMIIAAQLADADVAALYNTPCVAPATTPISRWFNNNNNGNDTVGSNNLTNNNTATFVTDVPYTCSVVNSRFFDFIPN